MSILAQYDRYSRYPLGRWFFNKGIGLSAPFFGTLKPDVVHYSPGRCTIRMADRRRVRNHIGTVNAGALCSLAELTGGLTIDSRVAGHLRWLPSGMTVSYIKKAVGPLKCDCRIDKPIEDLGEIVVPLMITDQVGDTVFTAEITFYISNKG